MTSKQKITYKFKNNLYINVTNNCQNRCVFCDKNTLYKYVNQNLGLQKDPSDTEIWNEVRKKMEESDFEEIVFCGFGEPLLRLETVLSVIEKIKNNYPSTTTRINTNGQVLIKYPDKNVGDELKKSGLNKINVSLNALSAEDYVKICRPSLGKTVYPKIVDFIKQCKNANIETTISFIEDLVNAEKVAERAKELNVNFLLRERIVN